MIPNTNYDVVIVGAGPAGLATLSALQEAYSVDHMNDIQRNHILSSSSCPKRRNKASSVTHKRIAVIDPSGRWMTAWDENMARLKIEYLRSPVMAHPDAFDETALLAFCMLHANDEDNNINNNNIQHPKRPRMLDTNCSHHLKGLGEADTGLWNLPSVHAFGEFCSQRVKTWEHDMIQDEVVKVILEKDDADRSSQQPAMTTIHLKSGTSLRTKAVVLAMGPVGKPIIPKNIVSNVSSDRILHWKDLKTTSPQHGIPSSWKSILVVGGGLTAVQVAQLVLDSKTQGRSVANCRHVVLCSRQPLRQKHFDFGMEWVDRRKHYKCLSDFYHQPLEDRLKSLQAARGGGSVPSFYFRQLEDLEAEGHLERVVGSPDIIHSQAEEVTSPRAIAMEIDSKIYRFDGVIVACGTRPDCTLNPVYRNLVDGCEKQQSRVFHGFPNITEDLEWFPNVFVVGQHAALNLGPDAGNLMGMRRGATLVANALGARSWLRDQGNVLANRYSIFEDSSSSDEDSSSDSDSDSDSHQKSNCRQGFACNIEASSSMALLNGTLTKTHTNNKRNFRK